MRLILGLSALAAVSAQTVTPNTGNGVLPTPPPIGTTALAKINCFQQTLGGASCSAIPAGHINNNDFLVTGNWAITAPNTVSALVFQFTTNVYTGQMQYRWSPGYASPATAYPGYSLSAGSYTCDPCAGGSPITCNTAVGPGGTGTTTSPSAGFQCASFTRVYTFSNLIASVGSSNNIANSFSVQIFDIQSNPAPNVTSYSFVIYRSAPAVVGDPQIYGIQGQDFQVHGIPDEIFNLITYPTLQVNARFVYLSSAECHDNFTACFAHPGTYVSEEGIRLGKDKIHVQAGSFKKGLTVSVNGKKVQEKKTVLKSGEIEMVNHRRVIVKTPIAVLAISNSDKFLNQEVQLLDTKLIELGKQRRELLVGESFHAEVPLHGLQGQTWRNIQYPSGLDYEGTIADYHVTDGNLYGTSFVFNKFKPQ